MFLAGNYLLIPTNDLQPSAYHLLVTTNAPPASRWTDYNNNNEEQPKGNGVIDNSAKTKIKEENKQNTTNISEDATSIDVKDNEIANFEKNKDYSDINKEKIKEKIRMLSNVENNEKDNVIEIVTEIEKDEKNEKIKIMHINQIKK